MKESMVAMAGVYDRPQIGNRIHRSELCCAVLCIAAAGQALVSRFDRDRADSWDVGVRYALKSKEEKRHGKGQ